MPKAREIRLNAFDMACVGHIQHGMWTHPRDKSADYTSLDHWVSLAQLLERGMFDGLFLADILGVYDVLEGSPAPSLRASVQIPLLDPMARRPGEEGHRAGERKDGKSKQPALSHCRHPLPYFLWKCGSTASPKSCACSSRTGRRRCAGTP